LKAYATLFFCLALLSVCFIDNNIQPFIAKIGRVSLAVFSALFIIAEAFVLFN
jgi:hypothetical protein